MLKYRRMLRNESSDKKTKSGNACPNNKNKCEPHKYYDERHEFAFACIDPYFIRMISVILCFQNLRLPHNLDWTRVIQTRDWEWNGYLHSATNDRVMSANTTWAGVKMTSVKVSTPDCPEFDRHTAVSKIPHKWCHGNIKIVKISIYNISHRACILLHIVLSQ